MQDKLNIYSNNITSQHGEDGILNYIIGSLEEKIIHTCCEFGAWDGVFASNCFNLWNTQEWSAVLIEGDKDKYKALLNNTKDFENVISHNCFVESRENNSLDDIFTKNNYPKDLGLLSIDIDSFDYHIWKNLNYVNPQIVVIEHNLSIPGYIDYHDPEDESYLRCSAKSLEKLGKKKGYKLICCTLSNCIFIKKDLFDKKKFPDYPVEYLFDYSSIQSQIIKTAVNNNRFPIFTKKISKTRKFFYKFYYKTQSLYESKVNYMPPTKKMKKHLKKSGLDA
jgi:hypothetical protein|tara:strand:- start:132 stop:968 length:837 start_codon:yes stop_codon:yes gene_type:complete